MWGGGRLEEHVDQLRHRPADVLAVVEHQERVEIPEREAQMAQDILAAGQRQPRGGGHGLDQTIGTVHRNEVHEPDAVPIVLDQLVGHGQTQARLTGPADPQQRHETVLRHRGRHRGHVRVRDQ